VNVDDQVTEREGERVIAVCVKINVDRQVRLLRGRASCRAASLRSHPARACTRSRAVIVRRFHQDRRIARNAHASGGGEPRPMA
jgi:hypothetical protein